MPSLLVPLQVRLVPGRVGTRRTLVRLIAHVRPQVALIVILPLAALATETTHVLLATALTGRRLITAQLPLCHTLLHRGMFLKIGQAAVSTCGGGGGGGGVGGGGCC